GRDAPVEALAFSPNGQELAIGVADGRVALVDMQRLRLVAELRPGHAERVGQLVYSQDGRFLASVGRKPDIRVWDAHRRVSLSDLRSNDPTGSIRGVAFDPHGGRLASVGDDLLLWDLESAQVQATLHNDTQFVYNALVWTPDGSRILAVTTTGLLDT